MALLPIESGGGIPDAPIDGKTYGRKDAAWTEVTSGGGGGAATVLWANRPAASTTPGGEIIVSDLGYQKMYSDGTNWRPVGGRLRLRSQHGLTTSPVATLTGAGLFAVPGGAVVIPAGLLTNDAAVTVQAESVTTGGTTGPRNLIGYIGTVNTLAGSAMFALNGFSSASSSQCALSTCVKFSSQTSAITRSGIGCGQSGQVASSLGDNYNLKLTDLTTRLNSSVVMYINVGTTQSADASSALVTYDVFVEM